MSEVVKEVRERLERLLGEDTRTLQERLAATEESLLETIANCQAELEMVRERRAALIGIAA